MFDLRLINALKFWKALDITPENNNSASIDTLRQTLPLLSAKIIYTRHSYLEPYDPSYKNYAQCASKLIKDESDNIFPAFISFLESLEEAFPEFNHKAFLPDLINPDTLKRIKKQVDNLPFEDLRYTFEYGISLAVEFEGLSIKKHSNLVSEFSAPLTAGFECISEVEPTTGDVFFLSAGKKFMTLEDKHYTIIKNPRPPSPYLYLKYSSFDFETLTLSPSALSASRHQFILIDPPFPPATGDSLFISDQTPKSALERLIKTTQSVKYDIAVTIIPRPEVTQPGLKRELLQRLFDGGNVVAVVEFSSFNKLGKSKLMTAVVTSNRADRHQHSVLFIDASALRTLDNSKNFSYMEFAAEILKCWEASLWPKGGSYQFENQPGKASKIASNIFEREFGDGYKDIAGLCKEVNVEQIINNDYRLVAKDYVGYLDKENKLLSIIDPAPVIEQLMHDEHSAKRVYVIGNNGAGKSLLLLELVKELCKRQRQSVGIAFGSVDRFPLETTKPLKYPAFTYAGARAKGRVTKSHPSNLAMLIKPVLCDPARLECFNQILNELGFSGAYYLIGPHKPTVVKGREPILLALSGDTIDNADVFTYATPRHTLGLMRETDNDQVVPFSELSSGEQQVLSLVIKILNSAAPGITFLIDEPEISLHVSWQNSIPYILERISNAFQCSFVVATHSPLLIANANHANDICFVAEDQKLKKLSSEVVKTVEGVLFDNFKTHTPKNRKIPERCAQLVSNAIELANNNASDADFSAALDELDQMSSIVKHTDSIRDASQHSQTSLIASAKLAIQELSRLSTSETKA